MSNGRIKKRASQSYLLDCRAVTRGTEYTYMSMYECITTLQWKARENRLRSPYVRTDGAEYTTKHNEQTQSHPPASTLALGNDRDAALPDDYPFLGIGDQLDHTQSLPQKGLGRTCPVHKEMSRLPSGQWPSQISNKLGSPIIRAMGSVPLE